MQISSGDLALDVPLILFSSSSVTGDLSSIALVDSSGTALDSNYIIYQDGNDVILINNVAPVANAQIVSVPFPSGGDVDLYDAVTDTPADFSMVSNIMYTLYSSWRNSSKCNRYTSCRY